MFTSARIKLTTWYLLIIMLISVMFSITIYRILTTELEREFHRISTRYIQEYGATALAHQDIEPDYLQTSENRILWTLLYINFIILGVSGVGGYVLAGMTLKPIRTMIDEQNRFIQDASHELRTPLTSLRSEIEVYLRGKNHTPEEIATLLQSNLEEVNNLQTLSDSLIKLAEYQKTKKPQVFTTVKLREVIAGAEKKIQKTAKQNNMQIITKIHNYNVLGDPDSLIQLFTILLDNALKYSPQKSAVHITSARKDGFVTIAVTDEGMGITEKDAPHIFDRFYRADASRSKQAIPGYGLGLSIAKKIVAEHHGSIRVKSALQKGTTFFVMLPAEKKG